MCYTTVGCWQKMQKTLYYLWIERLMHLWALRTILVRSAPKRKCGSAGKSQGGNKKPRWRLRHSFEYRLLFDYYCENPRGIILQGLRGFLINHRKFVQHTPNPCAETAWSLRPYNSDHHPLSNWAKTLKPLRCNGLRILNICVAKACGFRADSWPSKQKTHRNILDNSSGMLGCSPMEDSEIKNCQPWCEHIKVQCRLLISQIFCFRPWS